MLLRKVYQLIKFITKSYLFFAIEFIFIHIFCLPKSLNNYFFRWLVASLFLADFQWYYTIWSFNFFTASSCFPYFSWRSGFSGSRFFRAQVFKGSGFSGSGSRIWVHVLEVALTHYAILAQKSYFFKKTCFSWILNNFDQLLRFCEFVKQLLIFPSK